MATPPDMLMFFANYIQDQSGITYVPENFYQLETRLEAIAKVEQLGSIEELYQHIHTLGMSSKLSAKLLDSATNNETSFFRDGRVFDALKSQVIPKLFEAHPNRPIRIWSAASSTGQEIYSIAILLSEFAETHPTISYELLATDLSPRVLARAESGRYMDLEVRRGLTDVQLSKFFDRCSDEGDACTWKIKPDLRKHLQFQSLNLISTWPASIGQFDLILCRNVLIYQTVQQKQKVVANLAKHLAKTGYLILGGAESLVGISQDFAQEQVDGAIVYRFIAPP